MTASTVAWILAWDWRGLNGGEQARHWGSTLVHSRVLARSVGNKDRQERSKGDGDDSSSSLTNNPVPDASRVWPSPAWGTGRLASKAQEVLMDPDILIPAARV